MKRDFGPQQWMAVLILVKPKMQISALLSN